MTTDQLAKEEGNSELWQTVFGAGHPDLKKQHWLHTKLPSDPRCRMCLVPFGGLGGWVMRRRGKAVSSRNPHYCNACDGFLDAFPGGAEVDMSVLFVDIRRSVPTAQKLQPAEVSERTNRFLDRATRIITQNDGFIMAFYGDCVVAVWPPGFAGPDHAAKAIAAARALSKEETKDAIPIGVGAHTGPIYISTVQAAQGLFRDVSIFGHAVNVCARLSANAAPFKAVVSETTLSAAGVNAGPFQDYTLKGVEEPVKAAVL